MTLSVFLLCILFGNNKFDRAGEHVDCEAAGFGHLAVDANAEILGIGVNLNLFRAAIGYNVLEAFVFKVSTHGIYGEKLQELEQGDRLNEADLKQSVIVCGKRSTLELTANVLSVGNCAKQHLTVAWLRDLLAVNDNAASVSTAAENCLDETGSVCILSADQLFALDVYHGLCHDGVKTEITDVNTVASANRHHIDRLGRGRHEATDIHKALLTANAFDVVVSASAGIDSKLAVLVSDKPRRNLVYGSVSAAGVETQSFIRLVRTFFANELGGIKR